MADKRAIFSRMKFRKMDNDMVKNESIKQKQFVICGTDFRIHHVWNDTDQFNTFFLVDQMAFVRLQNQY